MATYYISPSGNDTTGNGSSGNPWLTISKAHTSAASGDTIICKDGTYSWVSQTFTKNLTIQAENTGLAIFDGGGGAIKWTVPSTFSLIGLVFQDAINTSSIFSMTSTVAFTATRCVFRELVGQGAFQPWAASGIFAFSSLGGSAIHNVVFVSCIFDDLMDSNTDDATYDFIWGESIGASETVNWSFTHCVVYLSTSGAQSKNNLFRAYSLGTVNIDLTNTTIANFNGETVTFSQTRGATINVTANYNCLYNITGAPSGTGNITSDPLFVDAASGNFNLRPTSPCLGAGTLV